MEDVEVTIPYTPRPLQLDIHKDETRFKIAVCHRRFGKTVLAVNELIKSAMTCELERPRFAYVAPSYRMAKNIAWDYLKHFSRPIPGVQFNESELRADYPNGARIQLAGAENPDSLRGAYWDGVILDEFSMMAPRMWSEIIRPALADRKGWAFFIGTPLGKNHFFSMYEAAGSLEGWSRHFLPASQTGYVDKEELEAARREMDPDEYAQEFECSFSAAIKGAFYADLINEAEEKKRILPIDHDRYVNVDTAWDLGIGDSTAIWFVQRVGKEHHVIDYYEASGVGLDHYAKVLDSKPYKYGKHYFPHDVAAKELGTGRSRASVLRDLGINVDMAPKVPVEDGIVASRKVLQSAWFDEERTKQGLEALRQYRREWDDKRQVFRMNPLHDWSSHAADAFRYYAVAYQELTDWDEPIEVNTDWIV